MLNKPLCRRLSGGSPPDRIRGDSLPVKFRAGPIPGHKPPAEAQPFLPTPTLYESPAVKVWDRAEIGSRLDPASLHRLDGLGLYDVWWRRCALSPCLRSRGTSPAYSGRFPGWRAIRYWSTTHATAMADADHRRPRFGGSGRRSPPGRLLPSRNGGR